MGALATDSFTADGTQRSFVVTSTILSESHVRVHFYYDDGLGDGFKDHPIPSSQWDLLGSAVLFNEPPTAGYIVKITTSSDGEGLDDAPTQYGLLASNVDKLIEISNTVVPNINEILLADDNANIATQKASEASSSATTATSQANIAITKASEALASANNASASELNAQTSETNAGISESNASTSESNALTYRNEAETFRNQASISETNAKAYADSLDTTNFVNKTDDEIVGGIKRFTASQRGTITVDNDGSLDLNATNNFSITPTGTFALTFTNIVSGQSGQILLDNTGGHIITADINTKVDANFLSTVSNAGVYVLGYFSNGVNVYVYNSGAMS